MNIFFNDCSTRHRKSVGKCVCLFGSLILFTKYFYSLEATRLILEPCTRFIILKKPDSLKPDSLKPAAYSYNITQI